MRRDILAVFFLITPVVSFTQSSPLGYYEDALLFSRIDPSIGSSARIQGIGGAGVATGGDISSIANNPAGLGFFNRSEFSLTPNITFAAINTNYLDRSEESFNNNFNVGNLGVVVNFTKGKYTDDAYKGGSLGISFSRKNSFHLERRYEARNTQNSIIDSFIGDAGERAPGDLSGVTDGAYDQYLITPVVDNGNRITGYDSFVLGAPIQSESIKEIGSHYGLNVAWGGNYDDKIYFGAGVGMQSLYYRQQKRYVESHFVRPVDNETTEDENLDNVDIADELTVRGVGVDFQLGVVVRPVHFMSLGVRYTSPTFMSLEDEYFFDVDATWKSGARFSDDEGTVNLSAITPFKSELSTSEYDLKSPSTMAVGATFFIGKRGFITADAEWIDYSASLLKSIDFSTAADNALIGALFQSVIHLKFGGEIRFDPFRIRGGYAVFPDAVKNSTVKGHSNITMGIGYRTRDYFLDCAVVRGNRSTQYVPYHIEYNRPVATSDINNTSVSFTFGLFL